MARKHHTPMAVTATASITPNPCPIADAFTFACGGLTPGDTYTLKLVDRVGEQFPPRDGTLVADSSGSIAWQGLAAWDGTNTVEVWQYLGGDTMDWSGPLASATVEIV